MAYQTRIDGEEIIMDAGISFTREEWDDYESEVYCDTCGGTFEPHELDDGDCEYCLQSRWERVYGEEGLDN